MYTGPWPVDRPIAHSPSNLPTPSAPPPALPRAALRCRRYLLGRINPLLASVVDLQGQHSMQASVLPLGGLWPSSGATLRVEPLRVVFRQSGLVQQALGAVRLGDRCVGGWAGRQLLSLVPGRGQAEREQQW